jgi:hypothetical protein
MVTMETKSRRRERKGMRPRIPRLIETMEKETQRADCGSGIKSRVTSTTARPARPMEEIVPGMRELYCSANWEWVGWTA